jgi:hypothetical protein
LYKLKFLTLLILVGCSTAPIYAVNYSTEFHAVAKDTTIRFSADVDVVTEPNQGQTAIGVRDLDSDHDGVPDYFDFCPDTPPGTKVWKPEQLGVGKWRAGLGEYYEPFNEIGRLLTIGCSGQPGEKRERALTYKDYTTAYTSGHMVRCAFYPESGDTWENNWQIKRNTIFKVLVGKLIENRGDSFGMLTVSTSAGTKLKIGCGQNFFAYSVAIASPGYGKYDWSNQNLRATPVTPTTWGNVEASGMLQIVNSPPPTPLPENRTIPK